MNIVQGCVTFHMDTILKGMDAHDLTELIALAKEIRDTQLIYIGGHHNLFYRTGDTVYTDHGIYILAGYNSLFNNHLTTCEEIIPHLDIKGLVFNKDELCVVTL